MKRDEKEGLKIKPSGRTYVKLRITNFGLKKFTLKTLKIAVLSTICTLLIPNALLSQVNEEEVLVPSIEGIIKIDGSGDEIQWEKATWTSNFWMWRPSDSLQAKKQTRFKIIRDEQNLYLLVEAAIDGTNFTTPNLKRDFSTFGVDYLTLLFDTF